MPSTNPSPTLACSLTTAERRERRALVRQTLLRHLEEHSTGDLEVLLQFTRSATLRDRLDEFVELERQCCGFLSFEISETAAQVSLRITGPAGSEEVLQAFAKAAANA